MTDRIAAEVEHDNLPDVLLKAIDVIETRGWHHGDFFDRQAHFAGNRPLERCGVCVRGALNVAAGFEPTGTESDYDDARDDAVDALAFHLGYDPDNPQHNNLYEESGWNDTAWFVTNWNDTPDRTAEQVTTALRECAAELSREAGR